MQRIDQLLSSLGYCTRSEARDWVREGLVSVKGIPAKNVSTKVNPAEVTVEDEPLDNPDGLLLLLNKPTGLVCSHDLREGPSIYTLFPDRWTRRNPVLTSIGRLDKETSGLILVTDLSPLVHKLTSPKHKVTKTYVATLDRDASPSEQEKLKALFAAGTLILEGEKEACAPAQLAFRAPRVAELILTEGKYHQVRRMFAAADFTVCTLNRERFGDLSLEGIELGKWKILPLNLFD